MTKFNISSKKNRYLLPTKKYSNYNNIHMLKLEILTKFLVLIIQLYSQNGFHSSINFHIFAPR